MNRKKFLYITHLSGKRVNRIWLSAIEAAQQCGYEVHLACNMDEIEPQGWRKDCERLHLTAHQIDFDRIPFRLKNQKAYMQLLQLLQRESFEVIHCNTPIGGVLGRLCAARVKVPYVIYQAHGFHFWHGAPKINWLLYYTAERYLAKYTDLLLTINREDFENAKHFHLKKHGKVEYIAGVGVDLEQIENMSVDRMQKRRELGAVEDEQLFVSVGELIARKNHATLVRAFSLAGLQKARLLICGAGSEELSLQQMIVREGLQERVQLLGFRADVLEILKASDVFVFPSWQEGLPVALMEAMAVGLPCIASRIRGNVDLLAHSKLLFEPWDTEALAKLLQKATDNANAMHERAQNLKCIENFGFHAVVEQMKQIYMRAEHMK